MVLLQIILSNLFLFVLWSIIGFLSIGQFTKKLPRLLYFPTGFVAYEAIFWLPGFLSSQFHWSWLQLSFVAGTLLIIVLFVMTSVFFIRRSQGKIEYPPKIQKQTYIYIAIIACIGIAHGVFQMGFWNSDHSYSDNAFYLTVANIVKNADHLFTTNLADGMAGSVPVAAYYITPYEMSLTFLSQFTQLHPAAFVQLTMPILGSVMTGFIFFELFEKLTRKPLHALVGVFLFYVTVLFAPNYRSNIDDYTLTEWFTYYYYTGKALVHFVVAPLLIYFYVLIHEEIEEKFKQSTIIFYIVVLNIIAVGFFGLSPVAVIYVLSLNLIFMLIHIYLYRDKMIKIMSLIFFGSIVPFIALFLSYSIQTGMSKFTNGVSDVSEISFFSSTYYSLAKYMEFFLYPKTESGYTFYRWMNVGIVMIIIIYFAAKFPFFIRKIIDGKKDETILLDEKVKKNNAASLPPRLLIIFGIYFPLLFLLFTFLPPVMSIVSSTLGGFVHQRLVGSYIYEVIVIAWIIWSIDQISIYVITKISTNETSILLKKATQMVLSVLSLIIILNIFIAFPQRLMPLDHARDTERQNRLRFQDEYYSGKFDFKLLLENPTKTDAQAAEIYAALASDPKEKIVAGVINQFFGLSHLRIIDSNIKIVRTRYTDYNDEDLNKKANIIKYYLSPTDKNFEKYQKDYTDEDLLEALKTFGVNYVVVLKSYKDDEQYGERMLELLAPVTINVTETENFYVINTDFITT